MGQQNGIKGGPIIVGSSEGEWCELCLLSLEELLNLELFVYLFVCVDPQVNNSLQELNLGFNGLTDEFTADDNFIHLGKLKKLDLSWNDLVNFPLDDRVLRAFENTLIELRWNFSLRSPPQSVIWPEKNLKRYLDDLRAESSPVVHIQVMVVGNGGVGKTTWCRTALLGKKPFFYGMVL